jgi:hypothetical protein
LNQLIDIYGIQQVGYFIYADLVAMPFNPLDSVMQKWLTFEHLDAKFAPVSMGP